MKTAVSRINRFLQGTGSVAVISLLGLTILLFAGILPAHRELAMVKAEIARLEKQLAESRAMQPVATALEGRIEREASLLGAAVLPVPFPENQLAELTEAFLSVVRSPDVSHPSARWRLAQDSSDVVLLTFSANASYEALASLFSRLGQWPHWVALSAMDITADGPDLALHFTLRIPVAP